MESWMNLAKMCERCWAIGEKINLSNIQRNPKVGRGAVDYYTFLAGFVRFHEFSTIVEVGTHFGGSALAMLAGGSEKIRLMVTVDISDLSNEYLQGKDKIAKVVGDGSQLETAEIVFEKIGSPIDFLFIDTKHTYQCTFNTFKHFNTKLMPTWIIFDDIALNEEMETAWSEISKQFGPENFINVATAVPQARRGKAGFGLIRARQ
jgi:hypothetical protein